MSTLYATERGFAFPSASEELTRDRRAQKTFDLPATAQSGRLYLLARTYPQNRHPLRVTVNGQALASISPRVGSGSYDWHEASVPAEALRVGRNVVEAWCDADAMDGWSLAVDYGTGSGQSRVSTDGGKTWETGRIGYLNLGSGEYIVRLRLAEGDDPPPPAFSREQPSHPGLGRLRSALPPEVTGPDSPHRAPAGAGHLDVDPVALPERATGDAIRPWDPATILAWGKAESGHDGRVPIVMCVHYAVLFVAACDALGIPARCVAFAEELNTGIGHFLAEVWMPDLDKWILVDPNEDALFVRGETPLSGREVQAAPEPLDRPRGVGPGA